ncbi:Beta-1,3-N-acetylglucosaminyltransferase lunatic fringe [Larimichthys crocea]|uniref:Uncharacterized protein n=1 Tax=Larimichthys crocea TaxID=215358 RepID=A0ACD3RX72_LARCR|nr:Beta-1,3-N-acetylglucosaminyltransferase lunatic fringe [Larimichthys crocea]
MWKPAGESISAFSAAAAAVTCLLVTGMLVVTVGHPSSGDPAEPPLAAAATSGKVISAYFRKLTRERRAINGPPRRSVPPPPVEHLTPADLFIAVKTTGRYHRQRLELLLDTWISRNMQQTWFCHVDDDNYLNVDSLLKLLSQYSHTQDVYIGRPSLERPIEATERLGTTEMKQVRFWFATGGAGFCLSHGLALKMKPWASDGTFMATAELIRLPDDCTVGYIVEALLGVSLIRSALFHSHLENLGLVLDIHSQVGPLSAVPRHSLVPQPPATLTPIQRQRQIDGEE